LGFGGALALLFCATGRAKPMAAAVRAAPALYLGAALLLSAGNILFLNGLRLTAVAHTLVIFATIPFWAALMGRITIGEAVARRTIVAMLIGAVGVGVLAAGAEGDAEASLLGDALSLAAAICVGGALVCCRRGGDVGMGPALVLAGLIGAVVSASMADFVTPSWTDAGLLLAKSAVILPTAWMLFLAGTRTAPAAEVGLLSIVETILGPLWAWAFIGPAPGVYAVIGGAIVLSGVALNAALSPRR
ncbi:MAG: DMT family transporter, partial [Pseudomonadota bacterium]